MSVTKIMYAVLLVSASIEDIKRRQVLGITYAGLLCLAVIQYEFDIARLILSLALPTLMAVMLLIITMFKDCIGGGDIKLIFFNSMFLGGIEAIYSVIIACILIVIVEGAKKILKKNKPGSIPMIPYLSAGSFLVLISKI